MRHIFQCVAFKVIVLPVIVTRLFLLEVILIGKEKKNTHY